MRFTIYQESRQGGRSNNEDRTTYCYSREALLIVVADGMGGHHYGEIAAQIAVQTLSTDQPMLKPMYTPGFASPEHYGSRKDLGPWSDIYSVGASMYACIAGCAPQAANERYSKDTLVPAMMRWEGEYSDRLLEIIDWCLNLNHFYRPQSVFALQKALVETITPPVPKEETSSWLDRVVEKYKKAGR